MAEYQEDMLKQSTIDDIRSKISDMHTLNVSAYDPSGIESLNTYASDPGSCRYTTQCTDKAFRPGTSHIAAADHSGLAISVITTINLLFGSHVLVPETGIIMNNEMNGAYLVTFVLLTIKLTIFEISPSPGPPTPSAMSHQWPTTSDPANGHSPPSRQ